MIDLFETKEETSPVFKCRNKKCNSENTTSAWREDMGLFGTNCHDCGKHTWQPKEGTKNRESSHQKLVKKKGIKYCEMCLRLEEQIPPPDKLEGHHIIEYKDNGLDDNSNVLVLCTPCHKLTHWARTYFGHYNKENS